MTMTLANTSKCANMRNTDPIKPIPIMPLTDQSSTPSYFHTSIMNHNIRLI